MASFSSGDGLSTSGDRRSEQEPDFYFVGFNARASTMVLHDLNEAVLFQNITKARVFANRLKALGMSPDQAVADEARDYPDSKRRGPLHVAAGNMHLEMCKMLIEGYGCDPNATNSDDETPLFFATKQEGSLPVVKYLITCGADPEKANNHGITPLHNAARRGNCEIARYLLFKGVNVDPLCQDGEAPLHFASLNGHPKMVKLLLDHNANLNRLSLDQHTPLVTSLFGSSLECFQALIQAGADINTSSRVTPLSVAARKGLADCIKCLLNYNADPNERNEYGRLPLEIAASKGWLECFKILFPVTNPLQKYAGLGIDQILEQEKYVRIYEEYKAIGEGDSAFWEKEYTHALECYNLALKLGHEDASLYAKRSLCHLNNRDQLRYLDDALSYMKAMNPGSILCLLPCFEEKAQNSVLAYFKEWKAHHLAASSAAVVAAPTPPVQLPAAKPRTYKQQRARIFEAIYPHFAPVPLKLRDDSNFRMIAIKIQLLRGTSIDFRNLTGEAALRRVLPSGTNFGSGKIGLYTAASKFLDSHQ